MQEESHSAEARSEATKLPKAQRHKKALQRTLIIAMFISIPFVAKAYIEHRYGRIDSAEFTELPPFFVELKDGTPLTRHELFGHVSLIVLSEGSCDAECKAAVDGVFAWIDRKLMRELEQNTTGRLQIFAFDEIATKDYANLKKFSSQGQASFREMLSLKAEGQGLSWALINQDGMLVKAFQGQDADTLRRLHSSMSRLTFNHFLDDYLAKRTFFGPRKESTESPPAGSS